GSVGELQQLSDAVGVPALALSSVLCDRRFAPRAPRPALRALRSASNANVDADHTATSRRCRAAPTQDAVASDALRSMLHRWFIQSDRCDAMRSELTTQGRHNTLR